MGSRKKSPDFIIIITVLLLLSIGIVMVFSSSSVWAFHRYKDSFYFLKRQLFSTGLGLLSMFFLMNYDYRNFAKFSKLVMIIVILLLILVLIPGIGHEINNARRWIKIMSFTIQPSEIAKLGVIIYTATGLANKRDKIGNLINGIMPFMIILGIVCLLILKQPDMSTAVVIAGTVMIMLFAAGAKMIHLASLVAAGLPLVVYFAMSEEYRWRRITSIFDPWADSLDTGYQLIQSLYALGSGGLLGLGLGRSRQKFFYLPEPQSDFIFSILCEELGFIGGTFVIILFLVLFWRGIRVAIKAPDYLGSILAAGIIGWIGFQSLINIGVVTASMPVTGLTLPFLSYGGSSLILTLMGIGILLNISRHCDIN
ncbi:MAG TPA: stage V sporulation protein E [Thermoanaerobacterales bacterium]|nr:stage V sporulation protein E [Thermoanaerobacterales bacterium]